MTDPEYIYHGTVTETGEIKLPGKKMRRELAMLAGHRIEVKVRRQRNRRSTPQLRYYWGCIVQDILHALQELDPETGWRADGVHELLKFKFLPLVREWREYVNMETGEAIREPLTTTKLTTVEEEMYHDHCRKWGGEFLGISIALPNEQVELFENQTAI